MLGMKSPHIEKEYKIKLDKKTYERLINSLDLTRTYRQINHYYSAPKDMGIRIREKENERYFTLKHYEDNKVKEYEFKVDSIDDPKVKELLDDLDIEDISYLGDLSTTRSDIIYPKAIMSLDKSEYLGLVDYELEYELKDSDIDDLKGLREILRKNDIKEVRMMKTKYERFTEANCAKIAIFCADGLEECEALIVMDLLKRAKMHVDLISMKDELTVTSSHGLTFTCDVLFKDMAKDAYDALILPGGLKGTETLGASKELADLLKTYKDDDRLIAAICAAPSIFIKLGFVDDDEFTVYPGFECGLRSTGKKAVSTKNIITGKGVGAAFEFSYEIIKYLLGEDSAKAILIETQYL